MDPATTNESTDVTKSSEVGEADLIDGFVTSWTVTPSPSRKVVVDSPRGDGLRSDSGEGFDYFTVETGRVDAYRAD